MKKKRAYDKKIRVTKYHLTKEELKQVRRYVKKHHIDKNFIYSAGSVENTLLGQMKNDTIIEYALNLCWKNVCQEKENIKLLCQKYGINTDEK